MYISFLTPKFPSLNHPNNKIFLKPLDQKVGQLSRSIHTGLRKMPATTSLSLLSFLVNQLLDRYIPNGDPVYFKNFVQESNSLLPMGVTLSFKEKFFHVVFTENFKIDSNVLEIIEEFSKLPSKLFIEWSNNSTTSEKELIDLIRLLPDLNSLKVKGSHWQNACRITKKSILEMIPYLEKLESLTFDNCRISEEDLKTLFDHLPNLKSVGFPNNRNFSNTHLKAIASSLQNIETLNLQNCNEITDAGLCRLNLHPEKLTHLILESCGKITDIGVIGICQYARDLRTIDLSHTKIEGMCLKYLEEFAPFLQSLIVAHCPLQKENINIVNSPFVCLDSLDMTGIVNLRAEDFIHFLEHTPYVKDLDFEQNPRVDDTVLEYISQKTPLRRLNLSFCIDGVTDKGLKSIANNGKDLQILGLRECHKVTDEGIREIALKAPKLRILDVAGCHLTDKSLYYMAKKTKELEELSLCDNNKITDKGIKSLSQRSDRIKFLDLDGCTQLTEKILPSLSRLRRLNELNMNNCRLTEGKVKNITPTYGSMLWKNRIPGEFRWVIGALRKLR